MFSHIMVGSNNIERSRRFYDALFATQDGRAGTIDHQGRLIYIHEGGVFMVTRPINGASATPANGGTVGFTINSADGVLAWHKAGCEQGGSAVEEAPGVRSGRSGRVFLAYLRDPDGNKLCAVHKLTT
jgi:catechol 2,3-dioxygenase-like lactoylglutathione lyase family enzyme